MSAAFLIQLLISAVAVAVMVGLAAWIGVPKVIGGMTEAQVQAVLADDHPDMPIDRISIAPDGKSAIATSGERALLVKRVGDGHAVQIVPAADIGVRRRVLPADRKAQSQTDVAA
jgi:hypothetical protein